MFQKWDYKTVLAEQGGINPRFEIDAVPAARPENYVSLFKKLGQDGWELVAHSASILPPPFASMTDEERTDFPLMAGGRIHVMRQPTMVYWWVFKRPLAPLTRLSVSPSTEAIPVPPPRSGLEVRDAEELKRQYQAGQRNFSGAQLSGAKLSGANLTKAYLPPVS